VVAVYCIAHLQCVWRGGTEKGVTGSITSNNYKCSDGREIERSGEAVGQHWTQVRGPRGELKGQEFIPRLRIQLLAECPTRYLYVTLVHFL
jgi:hypothetical protein